MDNSKTWGDITAIGGLSFQELENSKLVWPFKKKPSKLDLLSTSQAQLIQGIELLVLQSRWQSQALIERQSMLIADCIETARHGMIYDKVSDAEYKVFSQFGEDGILQYLIKQTNITENEKIFIEFGVENYSESTTRFLMLRNNWTGLILDSSEGHIAFIKSQDYYWRHTLVARSAFITRENINQLIAEAGISGEIGVLCIDIDGNDYWVWEAVSAVDPVIVVIEWNSTFGPDLSVTVPYDPAFSRSQFHASNLCYGASVTALEKLGQEKGYSLVGSNSAGNNLFFVRKGRLGSLDVKNARETYVESRFRESRDAEKKMTYLSGRDKQTAIGDAMLYDIKNGRLARAAELFVDIERRLLE